MLLQCLTGEREQRDAISKQVTEIYVAAYYVITSTFKVCENRMLLQCGTMEKRLAE